MPAAHSARCVCCAAGKGCEAGFRTAAVTFFLPLLSLSLPPSPPFALSLALFPSLFAAFPLAVKYGLAGSIWTADLARAHRVARRIESGILWVNCWLHRDLRTPFGGMKESGIGREGGKFSLEFYSEMKNICVHMGAP